MDLDRIDIEMLREDLLEYLRGAYLVTGFGCTLVEASDLENADDAEVVNIAINNDISLNPYFKDNEYKRKIY